jgi:acyl carrier protein
MQAISRNSIRIELIELLKNAREDWDSSLVVTDETGIFNDLGFESIDAVGLSVSLEDRFNRTLPFPEFMTRAKREQWRDVTVGRLVDFVEANLQRPSGATA